MFGRKLSPPPEPNVDELLRHHGREVLKHVYRGVLGREPDIEGLDSWTHYLRDTGRLDEMLRMTLASREFLESISKRLDTLVEPTTGLSESGPRIAIVSNCQGEVIGRAIQAYMGARPPTHRCISAQDRDDLTRVAPPIRALAQTHDVIFMQPVLAERLRPLLPEIEGQIELFPNVGFSAFQPDLCAVYRHPTLSVELSGPLGPYHSTIAYYAWRAGMSTREAIDLFSDQTYSALRFHDYWDASVQALREEGRLAGLPLDTLIERWRTRGCFMHSTTHPKLFVLADLARALLQRRGITPLPIAPEDVLHDLFGSSAVWPVYPEIAQRLGVEGSYWFKPVNAGVSMTAPVRHIDLETFVTESFAAYAAAPAGSIRCDRAFTERYREVFGSPARGRAFVALAAAAAPVAREHPYSNLPATSYWRRAVADLPAAEVDPVLAPRFTFGPDTRIVTAGSCFAQHISQALTRRGCSYQIGEVAPAALTPTQARARHFGVYSARYGNLYTPRQLVQLLDRAFGRFTPSEPAWWRTDGRLADPFRPEIEPSGFESIEALEADRERHLDAVRALFTSLEVFVFTLGLTEAWCSRDDGAVFPLAPGVVAGAFDSARHVFINFTHDEVLGDLESFIGKLRAVNPEARVLLTVSPVPLVATYEPRHVLVSTAHSKSVLRAAAAALCARHANVDYFPAYEIVTGPHQRGRAFAPDLRSVSQSVVNDVMNVFFRHYLPTVMGPAADTELRAEMSQLNRLACEEERLVGSATNQRN